MLKRSPLRVIRVDKIEARTTFVLQFLVDDHPWREAPAKGSFGPSRACYYAARDVRDRLRERLREAPFLIEPRRIVRRKHYSSARVYIFRVPEEHALTIATIVGEEYGRARRRYRRRHPVVL